MTSRLKDEKTKAPIKPKAYISPQQGKLALGGDDDGDGHNGRDEDRDMRTVESYAAQRDDARQKFTFR